MNRVEPNRNVYVGHRYVPLLVGEWDKSIQYEGLSIVTFKGASYTSKKMTPPGIDIENEEYWVLTGNYNAQIEYYRQDVQRVKDDMTELDERVTKDLNDTRAYVDDEVRKNREYVDSNVEDLKIYVDDEITFFDERIETLEEKVIPDYEKIVYKVPTDFKSLQEGIDYAKGIKNGIEIELLIEYGFKPLTGIRVHNMNLGHIVISSEDEIVEVDDNYTGDFMNVYNGHAPRLNCLIDMKDIGGNGYYIQHASRAVVENRCGVINAGECGVYVNNSTMNGTFSNFSGSNDRGAWITRGSNVSFGNSNFSNIKGGLIGIYISRSSIAEFADADVSNCGAERWAVNVLRSKLAIMNADLSNSSGGGIFISSGSEISAVNVNISECQNGRAVYAINGSTVDLGANSDLSNGNGNGIEVLNASTVRGSNVNLNNMEGSAIICNHSSNVTLPGSTAEDCKSGVYALNGSKISIPDFNMINTREGIIAESGSTISCNNVFLDNIIGFGLHADQASTISAHNCNINNTRTTVNINNSGSGVSAVGGSTITVRGGSVKNSNNYDLRHQYGSFISAHSCQTTNSTDEHPVLEDTTSASFNSLTKNGAIFV